MLRQSKKKIAHITPHKSRWGRWGVALLISVIFSLSVFCIPASAISTIYCITSQPQLTGNNCYVEVVSSNNWRWLLYAGVNSLTGSPDIKNFTFRCYADSQYIYIDSEREVPGTYSLSGYYIDMVSGKAVSLEPYLKTGTQSYGLRIWAKSFGSVSGIHGYNCDVTAFSNANSDFVVNYGSREITYEQLNEIISALNNSSANTEKAVDNANKKSEEREKQETQSSGDKATNDTNSAMPSVDSGFSNSLKSFVSSMSYNGTEAILPIPKTSIPAIAGVTDEVVLIPEQGYDLSAVISQYIPSNLLTLLQHLFDIALVLYCVYELYGLIQYVLTLKKGGKED
jgi:hypothetical protein